MVAAHQFKEMGVRFAPLLVPFSKPATRFQTNEKGKSWLIQAG